MTRVCAWCQKTMEVADAEEDLQFPITHGICETCSATLEAAAADRETNGPPRRTLNRVPQPLLAFSERLELIEASNQAGTLLGATPASLVGLRPGDLVRCVNAQSAQCGTTPECPRCDLRNALTATVRDAVAFSHAAARRRVLIDRQPCDVVFEFSAERVGKLGLLIVHHVKREPRT